MKTTTNRQRQHAGSGSQQIQVAGDLVFGVTESRAIEIAREQARLVVQDFTAEAENTARDRIEDLHSRVIAELQGRGLLAAFSDPSFQILLRRTQLAAAATAHDADHEILSKLLAERAQQPSKPMQMVISQATEVVEHIDDKALASLTAIWLTTYIIPGAPDPKQGLKTFNDLFSNIFNECELPTEGGDLMWLQRLDLMNCIRFHPGQPLVRWHMPLTSTLPGYVSKGVSADDAEEIRQRLNDVVPGLDSELVPHAFLENYFRINAGRSDVFLAMLASRVGQIEHIDELRRILNDARIDNTNTEAIGNMLAYIRSELPDLERLRHWWDSMQAGMHITPVGIALAYSNAKRFDQLNGLQSLSEMVSG